MGGPPTQIPSQFQNPDSFLYGGPGSLPKLPPQHSDPNTPAHALHTAYAGGGYQPCTGMSGGRTSPSPSHSRRNAGLATPGQSMLATNQRYTTPKHNEGAQPHASLTHMHTHSNSVQAYASLPSPSHYRSPSPTAVGFTAQTPPSSLRRCTGPLEGRPGGVRSASATSARTDGGAPIYTQSPVAVDVHAPARAATAKPR